VNEPVAEIRFEGDVQVRAFRRGTYLGRDHLEAVIERALGERYRFGDGWSGYGVVSLSLYEEPPPPRDDR
jgi:hypothetical protein